MINCNSDAPFYYVRVRQINHWAANISPLSSRNYKTNYEANIVNSSNVIIVYSQMGTSVSKIHFWNKKNDSTHIYCLTCHLH